LLDSYTFQFKNDISSIEITKELNNPFANAVPEIAKQAAQEFQEYITQASKDWEYDFETQKGKMFGVLVVELSDKSLTFLGTVSGTLQGSSPKQKLVPPIFNESESDAILSNGLRRLAKLTLEIKQTQAPEKINNLKENRKQHSIELQKTLFTKTEIINNKGEHKNVLEIFSEVADSYPPAAAGECAAPKLLQYALKHKLKPVAIAEFWWGNMPKSKARKHSKFYPACKEKCKPILEYMLDDKDLFLLANSKDSGDLR